MTDAERQELYTLMGQWGRKPEILYQKVREWIEDKKTPEWRNTAHAGALLALEGVESIVEFYLKREIESPANHQEFARQAQEKLDRFRDAKMSLAASGQRAIEAKIAEARLEEAEWWHAMAEVHPDPALSENKRLTANRAAVSKLKEGKQ